MVEMTPALPGLIGVSTSVLSDPCQFGALLDAAPDIVEWYALSSASVPRIAQFCKRHGVRAALHAPMPAPDGTWRFGPTSDDPAVVSATLAMTLETIDCASALDALHVVVHFPDPQPPYIADGFEDRARAFLENISLAAERKRVRVVLENMTPNPLLRSPAQYRAILDDYSTLGLCFDIGHAHLAAPEHLIDEYLDALADRIASVHVYNTAVARYGRCGHEPIAAGQSLDDGFFDWVSAVDAVLAATSPASWILEHDHRYAASTPGALAALREHLTQWQGVEQ